MEGPSNWDNCNTLLGNGHHYIVLNLTWDRLYVIIIFIRLKEKTNYKPDTKGSQVQVRKDYLELSSFVKQIKIQQNKESQVRSLQTENWPIKKINIIYIKLYINPNKNSRMVTKGRTGWT